MNRRVITWNRVSGYVARVTAGLSRRSALLVVSVASAGALWVISATPTPVAFTLAVGLAAAWCAWLEKHSEAPLDADKSTDDRIGAGNPR